MPKALLLGIIILSWYHIHDLHDYWQTFHHGWPTPWHSSQWFLWKYILFIGMISIDITLSLWSVKFIKNKPESTPRRISTIAETPPNDELSHCANYTIRSKLLTDVFSAGWCSQKCLLLWNKAYVWHIHFISVDVSYDLVDHTYRHVSVTFHFIFLQDSKLFRSLRILIVVAHTNWERC